MLPSMCGEHWKGQGLTMSRHDDYSKIPLRTFGVVRWHCGSNNNPNVGQFVGALKTSVNSLAFTGLCNTNCKDDETKLLYNLMHH